MSEDLRQPELNAVEAALTALKPATGGLDRDQLMYRAGQESMRGRPWLWPGVTAALTVAVAVLGTLLAARPALREVVHVYVESPDPPTQVVKQEPPASEALPPAAPRETVVVRGDYLRLREELLEGKVGQTAPAATYYAPENPGLGHLLGLPPAELDRVSRSRLHHAFLKSGGPL